MSGVGGVACRLGVSAWRGWSAGGVGCVCGSRDAAMAAAVPRGAALRCSGTTFRDVRCWAALSLAGAVPRVAGAEASLVVGWVRAWLWSAAMGIRWIGWRSATTGMAAAAAMPMGRAGGGVVLVGAPSLLLALEGRSSGTLWGSELLRRTGRGTSPTGFGFDSGDALAWVPGWVPSASDEVLGRWMGSPAVFPDAVPMGRAAGGAVRSGAPRPERVGEVRAVPGDGVDADVDGGTALCGFSRMGAPKPLRPREAGAGGDVDADRCTGAGLDGSGVADGLGADASVGAGGSGTTSPGADLCTGVDTSPDAGAEADEAADLCTGADLDAGEDFGADAGVGEDVEGGVLGCGARAESELEGAVEGVALFGAVGPLGREVGAGPLLAGALPEGAGAAVGTDVDGGGVFGAAGAAGRGALAALPDEGADGEVVAFGAVGAGAPASELGRGVRG